MKKILNQSGLLLLLSTIFLITFAGGGGGGSKKNDPNISEDVWKEISLYEDWSNTRLPSGSGFCKNPPMTFGSNLHPSKTVTCSDLMNYYSQIIVEDLDVKNSSKTFTRSNYGNTVIKVPSTHNFKLTYEFIDIPTDCMRFNPSFAYYFASPNNYFRIAIKWKYEFPLLKGVFGSLTVSPKYDGINLLCK
jgi:hypothetical protein